MADTRGDGRDDSPRRRAAGGAGGGVANASVDGRLRMEVTAVTHRGRVRAHNEDTIVVDGWIGGDSMDAPRRSVHDVAGATLVLVADGMGGHVGGREASRRAAEALVRLAPGEAGPAEVAGALRAVNREVFAAADDDPALRGMGTTVAGIVVMRDRTIWFNVGDSRVYSVRRGFVRQLSVDDVPVGAPSGSGRITQALGGAVTYLDIDPHVGSESTRRGRRYLLCSDGLTDALPLETIERALSDDDPGVVGGLLESALAAGAPDNVSIVVAAVRPADGDG